MPLYDFFCEGGHHQELVRPIGTEHVPCSTCGQPSHRSAINHFDTRAPSVDMAGLARRFEEAVSEREHDYRLAEQTSGQAIRRPNDLQSATKRAMLRAYHNEIAPEVQRQIQTDVYHNARWYRKGGRLERA